MCGNAKRPSSPVAGWLRRYGMYACGVSVKVFLGPSARPAGPARRFRFINCQCMGKCEHYSTSGSFMQLSRGKGDRRSQGERGLPSALSPPSDSCRWGSSRRHEAAESRAGDSRRRDSSRRHDVAEILAGNSCRPRRAPGLRRDSSRRHEVAARSPDYPCRQGSRRLMSSGLPMAA